MKPGKHNRGAGGGERIITGFDGNGVLVDQGLGHLGGHEPLPDQAGTRPIGPLSRYGAIFSGVLNTDVGRMASWAS